MGEGLLRGVHVLLVADVYDARQVVQAVLEYFGASVTTAASAAQAMELLCTTRPNVLVGDLQTWLIREVRAGVIARGLTVPVIAIAGNRERRDALLAEGVDACFVKPLDLMALCYEIRRYAGPYRGGNQTRMEQATHRARTKTRRRAALIAAVILAIGVVLSLARPSR